MARALEGLLDQVQSLSARLAELESEREARPDALSRPWSEGPDPADEEVLSKRAPDRGG